jgi:tetratricopeptide (TPR) repeat protein
MKKVLPFLFLLIFAACNGDGSDKKIPATDSAKSVNIKYPLPSTSDSLLTLLKILPEDTNKVNVLNALGRLLKNNHPDTAVILGNEALSIAKKSEWKKGIANSYSSLGAYYYIKSDYLKSIENFLNALQICEGQKDKKGISSNLANIGLVYYEEDDYSTALDYYFKSLELKKELGNKSGMAVTLGNIGIAYAFSAKEKVKPAERDSLFKKALDYYFQALEMAKLIGDKNGVAADIGNIGLAYFDQKNYTKALDYYFQTLQIREEIGDQKLIASTIGNIGLLYIEIGKYPDAFNYLYRALAISDSIGAINQTESWYAPLSSLYEKSSVPLLDSVGGKLLNKEEMRIRSLHYFQSYISLRDSIFSEENKKQLVRKEMNYEFEKKESKQKADQDKKNILAGEELKQREKERNYFIVGFALVILLAGFIFRGYRQKQKANEIIFQQKFLAEEKQKEILDSIQYAKRIQLALLPTEKYIERNLNRLQKNK